MSGTQDHNDLIIRWLNGELSKEELEAFKKSDDYAQYQAIVEETDSWSLPSLDVDASYGRLTGKKSTRERTISWYQTPVFRIAAVFLLLLSALLYFLVGGASAVSYKTGLAEAMTILLPDSSNVQLSPASALAYDEAVWQEQRRLTLDGSAYFEVTRGKTFEVVFGQGTVAVHGTSFEIKSFDDYASVTCYEGKVEVIAGDSTVMLTRGKGVKISVRYKMRLFDFQNTSWSANSTRFNQAPLSAVLSSLEARFGVTIISDTIDTERTFTGAFPHSNVEVALNIVCTAMSLTYEKTGNTVTLQ